jgi:hypothetical protein
MTWDLLRNELGWGGAALALIGMVALVSGVLAVGSGDDVKAQRVQRGRLAVLALTGLAYVVSVAFNLVYTIGDIYVMYISSYLMLVLWMAIAAALMALLVRTSKIAGVGVVLLFLALPIWLLFANFTALDQSDNTAAREQWEMLLAEPLPSGAILISNDRNEIMPMWYLQYVDRVRSDLLGLYPLVTPDYPALGHVLDLALSTGRPVYLIKEMPGIDIRVDTEPEGAVWRVLGPAAATEPAFALDAALDDAVALVGYDRSVDTPAAGDTMRISLYWEALHPLDTVYHSYVHLRDASSETVAQSDQQPGGVYYPTTLWRPDERLRDDHTLQIPADAPAGIYRIVVGMYALSADGALQSLGEPVVIGQMELGAGAPVESVTAGQTDCFSSALLARSP